MNGAKVAAHGGRLAGLNQGDETVVHLGNVGKKTNCSHQRGAKESNDHDFQMCAPVGVVHRMTHRILPKLRLAISSAVTVLSSINWSRMFCDESAFTQP